VNLSGKLRWIAKAAVALTVALPALAQYPGQIKKQDKDAPVLRSIAVLEYTGDPVHPKASRLVPVSVFDGQQLQDGGIYLARPQPLALDGGVEYQLQLNGRAVGYFDIQGAGQSQGSWVGQGILKPLVAPRSAAQLARAQRARIKIDEDDAASDGPVLHRKSHDDDDSGSNGPSGPPPDPDRPTLHKAPSADSGSGNTNTASGESGSNGSASPAADPDRPTLHKASSADSDSGSSASADPDRPKLNKKSAADGGSVESVSNSSDPDRPHLKRGMPADLGIDVTPTVIGLPPDLEQEVAVSDAKTIPDHPWSYTWANLDDETKMKASLEDLARTALGLNPPPALVAPAKTPTKAATKAANHKTAPPPPPPAPAQLLDEQFRVFELAYGSGATMVLSAHSDGAGAQGKFVTLVAQPNLYGSVVVLLKSVTDPAHLDDTPRMRLVDAVDAMGDNRGELLFELRGKTQRQFALYRVLRGSAEKLFVTGGEYIGSPAGE
jgi:hypothetical protein